jgi:hypothetical protein
MSTDYIHTDESARDTIRQYRDGNGFDTFAEAIADMQACFDDLDDEDKSALRYVERDNELFHALTTTPRKFVRRWCVLVTWSDGTVEERTDVPPLSDLDFCLDEWEFEANK